MFSQKEVLKIAQTPVATRSAKQSKQLSEYLRDLILKMPEEKMGPKIRSYLSEAMAHIKVHHFKKGSLVCTHRSAK